MCLSLVVRVSGDKLTAETYKDLSNPIDNIWKDISGNWIEGWDTWHGLGACRNGKSLVIGVKDSACIRMPCLISTALPPYDKSYINVSALISANEYFEYEWTGPKELCYYPARGHVKRFNNTTPNKFDQKVSFIYTVHNSARMCADTILETYLTAHEVNSAEFVIVYDGVVEDFTAVRRLVRRLQYLFNADFISLEWKISKGFGHSNNKALEAASGKFAVTMNSDVYVLPGWISLMLWTIITFPGEVGMVGPLQIAPNKEIMEVGGLIEQYGNPANGFRRGSATQLPMYHARIVDYISAACLLFNREQFLSLGLFDKQYEPAYYEDTDAAMTYLQKGFVTIIQPLAVVIHKEGRTISSKVKEILMSKNKNKFYQKHKNLLDHYCPHLPPHCARQAGHPLETLDIHTTLAMYRQPNRMLFIDSVVGLYEGKFVVSRTLRMLYHFREKGHSIILVVLGLNKGNFKLILNLLASGINVVPAWKLKYMFLSRGTCPFKLIVDSCLWNKRQPSTAANVSMFLGQLCPDAAVLQYIKQVPSHGKEDKPQISPPTRDPKVVLANTQKDALLISAIHPNSVVKTLEKDGNNELQNRIHLTRSINQALEILNVSRDPIPWRCPLAPGSCPIILPRRKEN